MFDENFLGDLQDRFEDWQKKNKEKFKAERKPEGEFKCDSGIPVKRVYTPLDLAEKNFDYMKDVGLPGEYPFVRGWNPIGMRGELPVRAAYTGYATPEMSNKAWKEFVEAGKASFHIMIAYDLPTQLGYDPDNPRAEGEVGRTGVSMVSLKDWEIAFDGIDITKVPVAQVANANATVAIANHFCLAKSRGLDLKTLKGSCQNDILKEYIVRGNYIYPVAQGLRLAVDSLVFCAQEAPKYDPTQTCGAHFSEFQAAPLHDAAFMLANAFCLIETAVKRGIDVDSFAPSVTFLVAGEHYGFFQEIAKARAIRKVYARTMKERFKAKKPESMMARMTGSQGGNSLQRVQYLNNIARTGIFAVATLLGGCQGASLRTYDEQFGIPSPEAIQTSTRVWHIVTQETGILDTVDPLAGSYFVEWLTSEFEERITAELEKIDKLGGVVKCIENGYQKKTILQDAYQWQKDFEDGKIIRVGANFATSEADEGPRSIYRTDPKIEQTRVESVKELKRKRDNRKVKKALSELKATAALPPTLDNQLMPPMMEAVSCYATNGEIAEALREVWGEYKEPSIF